MEKKKDMFKTIKIPTEIYEKLEQKIDEVGFTDVSEYVTFILEQILEKTEKEEKETISEKEKEFIKQRLRELGYIE